MKKILFVFIVVAGLFSCSKEDWFENIQPEINFFAVEVLFDRRGGVFGLCFVDDCGFGYWAARDT